MSKKYEEILNAKHNEGLAGGQVKGRAEKTVEIAKNMLSYGVTVEHIALCCGLSVEEVNALKKTD